jgi:hypothetical protein
MSYATNAQFIHNSGIGTRIVDETVGIGTGSLADFDLDHGNVITGTYVLSYATAGSNSFTALTETTDYSLDKESGRIVLTAGGITALSTKTLYATYWYSEDLNDSDITDLITSASDEVDILTGRRWTTATAITEYLDGSRTLTYPTTDEPFMEDYDPEDYLCLRYWPVTSVSQVYFLEDPQPIGKFWNYDAGTATYTDKTTEVNSSTEAPFTLFDSAPAVNDFIYIGSNTRFIGLRSTLTTVGTGTPAIDWEYYTSSGWTDITETEIDANSSTFKASGKFVWSYPYGWTTNAVNGYTAYWIRGKLTSGYTIAPVIATLSIVDPIYRVIEPRNYNFRSNGQLVIYSDVVSSGYQNIRVDYSYGYATTPSYIVDLTTYIAAIKAYVRLSGGAYDDATSYTLGSKSVTIGEAWVNIREVISQAEKRVEDILNKIGRRADIKVI